MKPVFESVEEWKEKINVGIEEVRLYRLTTEQLNVIQVLPYFWQDYSALLKKVNTLSESNKFLSTALAVARRQITEARDVLRD